MIIGIFDLTNDNVAMVLVESEVIVDFIVDTINYYSNAPKYIPIMTSLSTDSPSISLNS